MLCFRPHIASKITIIIQENHISHTFDRKNTPERLRRAAG